MGRVTTIDQSTRVGLLRGRLRAARQAVARLDHVEGRLGVRRDTRGRRYVVPLGLAESRVRELVVRVTRNARRTVKAAKTG
jgi:hypothetical protein